MDDYHMNQYNYNDSSEKKYETQNGLCFLLILLVCLYFMGVISQSINKCRNSNDDLSNTPLLNKEMATNYNDICAICLDNYKENDIISELDCNHIYHNKCISDWIIINNTCPQCRTIL